ncbi:hypothetical protein HOY80DRAFT_495537 [Tuber brumale]|nr:hypothetical protein HOY80DRAFT_495537 [Tuber brumale]
MRNCRGREPGYPEDQLPYNSHSSVPRLNSNLSITANSLSTRQSNFSPHSNRQITSKTSQDQYQFLFPSVMTVISPPQLILALSSRDELHSSSTVLGVVGKSGEVILVGSLVNQLILGLSMVSFIVPRVRQTFFHLENRAKIGCPDGHTHLIFACTEQSSPYLCSPPSHVSRPAAKP